MRRSYLLTTHKVSGFLLKILLKILVDGKSLQEHNL